MLRFLIIDLLVLLSLLDTGVNGWSLLTVVSIRSTLSNSGVYEIGDGLEYASSAYISIAS